MTKLKIRLSNLSAGRPIAILNKKFAENSVIHVDDRITIEKNGKKIIAVVDTATGLLKNDELLASNEVVKHMGLKKGDIVDIKLATKPESLKIIYEKLNCKTLSKEEIENLMNDIVANKLTEAEIAYFVAGVYKCGMSMKETAEMTQAIVDSGKQLNMHKPCADKHSIGGIPGRTTPIVISICAAGGLTIPKTSSRSITTPAGTADAMEVICKVDFTIDEMKKIVEKTNACLVWGGALNLAPADDKIIQVEKLLNLDPEAQLLASILAKKLAVNAKYILIDIPYGKYAKVTKIEGIKLAKKFKELAKYFDVKLECFLKQTEEPIGNGIGPALEIKDVIKVLKRESPCYQLEEKSLELAAKLFELTGKADKNNSLKLAKSLLDSGKAFKKFKEIVEAQKGKINGIQTAKFSQDVFSEKNGKIVEINTKLINSLCHVAGCPINKLSGMYLYKHLNDAVQKGDKLFTLYTETKDELVESLKFYRKFMPITIK